MNCRESVNSGFECLAMRFFLQCRPVRCKVSGTFVRTCILGNSVMVARLTLDQLVGVRIPVPQFFLNHL